MVMLSSKHYIDDHIDTCVTLERRVCAFDKFKGQYQQQFNDSFNKEKLNDI